jgi:hypothetical protein
MESIGCCGSHLECQTTGICTCERRVDCGLYNSTIQYKLDTLYKLKNLGLVNIEDNHPTDKGVEYLRGRIGQLPPAALLLLILFVQGEGMNGRLNVLKIKNIYRGLTRKLKK